jgi:hypothetical protein
VLLLGFGLTGWLRKQPTLFHGRWLLIFLIVGQLPLWLMVVALYRQSIRAGFFSLDSPATLLILLLFAFLFAAYYLWWQVTRYFLVWGVDTESFREQLINTISAVINFPSQKHKGLTMQWWSISFWSSLMAVTLWLAGCAQPTPTPTTMPDVRPAATANPIATQEAPVNFWTVLAQSFVVEADLAFVAAGTAGLHLFNMANPDQPTAVAHFDLDVWDVKVHEQTAYLISCRRRCVYSLDLSGEMPTLLPDVFYARHAGAIVALAVQGTTLYLAGGQGVLETADMAHRPWQTIATRSMPGTISDLAAQFDFLYVTLPAQGIYLFDATDPADLREQDFYAAPKPAWPEDEAGVVWATAVDEEQAYVAAGSRGVRVLHHAVNHAERHRVNFQGDYFYLVRGQATAVIWQTPLIYVKSWQPETGQYHLTILRHLDEAGIYIPINLIGEYPLGGNDLGQMGVWNGRVYFTNQTITHFPLPDGYQALVGIHPIRPALAEPGSSEVQFIRHIGGEKYSLALQEEYAYVGLGNFLRIYDVTNPARPVEVNTLLFSETINEIKIHKSHAYLRMEEFERGHLLILDISDPPYPEEVTRIGSFVQSIALEGNYAYVIAGYYTYGTSFLIWDISDPADVQFLASFSVSPHETVTGDNRYRMFDLAVVGDMVYIAWGGYESCAHIECRGGLLLLDSSNKMDPRESGVFFLGAALTVVAAAGETTFGLDEYGQLIVFDVSDRENPRNVAVLEAGLSSQWQDKMVVAGDELWVADGRNGFRRFDLTDLTQISEKSGYPTEGAARNIALQDDLIYLVSVGAGLEILRKEVDDQLVLLTAVTTIANATDIVVNGSVAYIADNERGLTVWDLTEPLNPVRIGPLITGIQYPLRLILADDRLYALSVDPVQDHFPAPYTVDVFDVSQPFTPIYQLTLPFKVDSFAVYNDRAYVTDGSQLSIWNLDNLEAPELIGLYEAPGKLPVPAAVSRDIIYLAVNWQVMLILDASDPQNIQPVFSINEAQGIRPILFGAWDLKAVGDRLYSICDWSGLCIYDLSQPAHPVFLNTVSFTARDFEVVGDHLYILAETSRLTYELTLEAYQVGDPVNARQITAFSNDFRFTHSWPAGLAVADEAIYVALGSNGLLIFALAPVEDH